MNRLAILTQLVTLFRLAKRQPLVCVMIIMVALASFKQEAYIILEYYGIVTYEQFEPHASKESMVELATLTDGDVVSVWGVDYKIPQSITEMDHISMKVDIEHIPTQKVPITKHPQMITKFYSNDCYDGAIYSSTGFSEYITQGIKYVIACPIVGEDRILRGFTMVMFLEYPEKIERIMSNIVAFNKTKVE